MHLLLSVEYDEFFPNSFQALLQVYVLLKNNMNTLIKKMENRRQQSQQQEWYWTKKHMNEYYQKVFWKLFKNGPW